MGRVNTDWTEELREQYRSGAHNQFLIHGNIADIYPPNPESEPVPLTQYLCEHLLNGFDLSLVYSLSKGLTVHKGGELLQKATRDFSGINPAASMPPAEALSKLNYLLFTITNLARIRPEDTWKVAIVIEDINLIAPASSASSLNYKLSNIALTIRNWSSEAAFRNHPLATLLLSENLSDAHPLITRNPRLIDIQIPLPSSDQIRNALQYFTKTLPNSTNTEEISELAPNLCGLTLTSVEEACRLAHFQNKPLSLSHAADIKKQMIEQDARDLLEFIPPKKNFEDLFGLERIKAWVSKDLDLWHKNHLQGVPKGYLLCGPVGTGKTYLAECIAGEANIPTVILKNFRDKWVGTSEGNLEKIFRLLHALGRCVVFIDEADQTLGQRNAGGDSGLSGRLYSMIAQEMSKGENRGRILWILASSRPDLIEVDLKRPGRIDTKIPILPTSTPEESLGLIRILLKRNGLELPRESNIQLATLAPKMLTPGSAEALAAKVYRDVHANGLTVAKTLQHYLENYHPPVPLETIEAQVKLAVNEATDMELVPDFYQKYKTHNNPGGNK